MPLLDHFHAPLSTARHWESFHASWATEIMKQLNRRVLPPGYFAEAQIHIGGLVEIDVPTFEEDPARAVEGNGGAGGVGVQTWAPPTATLVMPAVFPDQIEVQVFSTLGGATLVAAIEVVSPRNKDRREARRTFAAKCATYLQAGVGLVMVDVVTVRLANMHHELLDLLEMPADFRFPAETRLYAAAYRPGRQVEAEQIELWLNPLTIGANLPVLPLALRGGPTLPLDLETTYTEVCRDSRL